MVTRGAFIVSIDYEYAWGFVDHELSVEDLERIRHEREITKRLMRLFDTYALPATWAVVGKLIDTSERGDDAAWYDTDRLVDALAQSSVGHDIGSHSYGHVIFTDIDEDAARRDSASAIRAHNAHGFAHHSFVFPRNKEKYHAVLADAGFRVFRGQRKQWYHFLPYRLWTLGRGIDYWLPIPHLVEPLRHESGLINIQDSLLFISRRGVQRLLPPKQAIRKIVWGLRAAAREKKVFHLWFHPSNFSYDTETQFFIFEEVLKEVSRLRDKGVLDVHTMYSCSKEAA